MCTLWVHFRYMNTKFVGVREFRQDIAGYAKRARNPKTRFVVVSRSKPLFEITPFAENETIESLFNDILAAKRDIAEGKVYTEDEVLAELA